MSVLRGIALDGLKPEAVPKMRYAVFAGDDYYPHGGWKDFRSVHETLVEADAAADALVRAGDYMSPDWWQVVDLETQELLSEGRTPKTKAGDPYGNIVNGYTTTSVPPWKPGY